MVIPMTDDKETEDIKERLSKMHSCYILITCGHPEEDGNMQIQMSYEGDRALAACMLEGAQTIIDSQED